MNNAHTYEDELREWTHTRLARTIAWSAAIFLVSLFINYVAGTYATAHAGAPIHDLILDNVPTISVHFIFVDGIVAFFAYVAFLVIRKPTRAPFVLLALSTFIFIRSFFVVLTHVGALITTAPSTSDIFNLFTFGGDEFFSAHTGLPFLMALIFWERPRVRIFFLLCAVLFGVAVLLGHLHYSIDVFSAFFITYGIVHIAKWLFPKEYKLFRAQR